MGLMALSCEQSKSPTETAPRRCTLTRMSRAFLCHSSDDKPFVERVATLLGRSRTVYDSFHFRPGDDLRAAIRDGIAKVSTFVFFVSDASLRSTWCRLELNEAEHRAIADQLPNALALILDANLTASALPEWMRDFRAIPARHPSQAFREIDRLLTRAASGDPRRIVVGRTRDLEKATRKLALNTPPPRVLIVSGLDGIGRRTFLRRLADEVLGLTLGPEIVLPSAGSLEDLWIRVLEETDAFVSRDDIAAELQAFRDLSPRDRSKQIADRLSTAFDGALPCIVDNGCLLAWDGTYTPEAADILKEFSSHQHAAHLALVHTRVPRVADPALVAMTVQSSLQPLERVDVRVLLTQLLRQGECDLTADQIDVLSNHVAGFPPAAHYLATQVEAYGVDVVLADRPGLDALHARNFSRFVGELDLSGQERDFLKYLANEVDVPLRALATVLNVDEQWAAGTLVRLMDLNLVESRDGRYAVVEPLRRAIARVEGAFHAEWYAAALDRLETAYWANPKLAPPIPVVDMTIMAAFRSGQQKIGRYSDLIRASMLVVAAHDAYHHRDYRLALEYADRAERMGARLEDLDEVVIKALAQLERIAEARSRIDNLSSRGDRRQWYLRGFVARKVPTHDRACEAFQKGFAAGDTSVSLMRDYADSLARCDQVEAADQMAARALKRDQGNVYVLDLIARLRIEAGTLEHAKAALEQLERADVKEEFIHHRRATFLLRRVKTKEAAREAVGEAELACGTDRAPFEAFTVLANALIESGEFEKFRECMDAIDRRFPVKWREDLKTGLELKAAVRQADWRSAEFIWPRIRDKRSPVHRALRVRLLDQKADDPGVLQPERADARSEAATIRGELEAASSNVWPIGPRGEGAVVGNPIGEES